MGCSLFFSRQESCFSGLLESDFWFSAVVMRKSDCQCNRREVASEGPGLMKGRQSLYAMRWSHLRSLLPLWCMPQERI